MLLHRQGDDDAAILGLSSEPPLRPGPRQKILQRLPLQAGEGDDGDRDPRLLAQVAVTPLHGPLVFLSDDAGEIVNGAVVVRREIDAGLAPRGRRQEQDRHRNGEGPSSHGSQRAP